MDKANPWSQCCKRNSLSNEGIFMIDTLQLTQEKEKSSVAQCSTGWFKNNFLEWDGTYKQNIYLLEHENFALMQIFVLPQVVANYLNDASRYIALVECNVFWVRLKKLNEPGASMVHALSEQCYVAQSPVWIFKRTEVGRTSLFKLENHTLQKELPGHLECYVEWQIYAC